MSPSLLSQLFSRKYSGSVPAQNNPGQHPKQNKKSQASKQQSVSKSVSHNVGETRGRSESVDKQDSRGRPRNENNRGRRRSVKPRNGNGTTVAAPTQGKKQNLPESPSSKNGQTNTQTND